MSGSRNTGYGAAPTTRRSNARPKGYSKGDTSSGLMTEMQANFVRLPDHFHLVHQCNCISKGPPKGLASSMFNVFPAANVYDKRRQGLGQIDTPGTISKHGRVLNLYGQWYPGNANDSSDSAEKRFGWFKYGLQDIGYTLPQNQQVHIAFPERIGCGLAGGDWNLYRAELYRWAANFPRWKCFIVKRE